MSSRQDLKGSSRSTRDDSRRHDRRFEERRHEERHRGYQDRRDKSRSRSPSSRRHDRYSSGKHRVDYRGSSSHRRSSNNSEEDVPAPPPPPRITKISIDFSKPKVAPIKLNVGGPSKSSSTPKPTVASIFNTDDDEDEPEEMPAEAKMRMRNIGRDTPTSAGPNSFGKTKQGFCDSKKVFEKNLKQQLEDNEDRPKISSLPQTIYKIKGP